ncbi:calcium-transporting ATPase 5, plasma membrane-type-like [Miscanthus floridulus]|uniref:calcium-transporting ATPase 5, plasma membrane-type-like n=1 Tax=Miscanthus floridulus TaxID=154761 RepID=UPI0034599E13
MAPVSAGASRPSLDSDAPSTLCRGCWVAPAVGRSAFAIEPIGLTARFPNARASGVSASAPGRAIASPEASSPPPPGDVGPFADALGAVPLTSERWSRGPRPASLSSSSLEESVNDAISDYKQSLQFQNLNEEKQNIRLEVVRGGRRITVSIYDLVVGDVVPLKIGDQVPADGILVSGHSLSIDESSMTGESKIVHKDQKSPFLMSGCKVADGYGTMLVTAVGINTEWGLLMASISEDSGEATPLQVRLNGVSTFIGMVGLSVALAVLVVLLARYFTGHTYNPDGSVQYVKGKMGVGQTIRRIFTVAFLSHHLEV